jgi:hypothetical protein
MLAAVIIPTLIVKSLRRKEIAPVRIENKLSTFNEMVL